MSPPVEFEALVRTHTPKLRRFCTRLAGPTDGDDLMQETLTRAMVNFGSLRDQERFLPWCRQIARNAHARRVQSTRPTEPLEDTHATGDLAAEVVDDLVLRHELAAVLAALPERSRQVLTARAEGVPPAVLATEFGVSRTLIDTWFSRSRAQARLLLRNVRDGGMAGLAAIPLRGLRRGQRALRRGQRALRRGQRAMRRGQRAMRLARRPILGILAAGVGVSTLLLTAPQPRVARSPRARRATAPAAAVTVLGPSVLARGPAPPRPAPAAARPTAHTQRAAGSPTTDVATLGLPRTFPSGSTAAMAVTLPIVIGPLLPGDQLVVGIDPCGLLATMGLPCPDPVGGVRAAVRLPTAGAGVPMRGRGTAHDPSPPRPPG